MKVFAQERQDGLADRLTGPGRLLLTAAALPAPTPLATQKAIAQARVYAGRAEGSVGDPDLYPLNSVLVSTGWNLNDAVFVPEEVAAARSTPEDKPFNLEHAEADIIGHITAVTAKNRDGGDIPADAPVEDYPADFDLHTSAVLYRVWQDEKLQERMDQIVAGIPKGDWFVSMECLYRDFDYALLEADGTQKVVARNKATAFLTKHLRFFGGDGTFQGARVGQVLRAFVFSGKGLVKKPANPASVIYPYSASARFYTSAADAGYHPLKQPAHEGRMEKELAEAKDALKAAQEAAKASDKQAAEAKAALEATEKAKAAVEAAKADADKKAETLAADLAKANESLKTAEAAKADADKATAAEAEAHAKTKAELTKVVRTQAAVAKGLDAEAAGKLVATSAAQTDEQFVAGLEVMSGLVAKASKTPLPETEKNKPTVDLPETKTGAALAVTGAGDTGPKASKTLAGRIVNKKPKAGAQE
jgi:hypothetical protein